MSTSTSPSSYQFSKNTKTEHNGILRKHASILIFKEHILYIIRSKALDTVANKTITCRTKHSRNELPRHKWQSMGKNNNNKRNNSSFSIVFTIIACLACKQVAQIKPPKKSQLLANKPRKAFQKAILSINKLYNFSFLVSLILSQYVSYIRKVISVRTPQLIYRQPQAQRKKIYRENQITDPMQAKIHEAADRQSCIYTLK